MLPPGGYAYTQPETGMVFGGNELFPAQCRKILAHRRGNHLGRATLDEVKEDVIAATCARLPALCEDVPLPATPLTIQQVPAATAAPVPAVNTTVPAAPRKARKCGACGGRKK